jgi:hypothetical protein
VAAPREPMVADGATRNRFVAALPTGAVAGPS